jgi:hypothetical protein
MRRTALVALALLTAAACTRDAHADRGAGGATTPPAVPLPRIIETVPSQMDGAWGLGLRVRYETALDITDVPRLRLEADSIWAAGLRESAERHHICTVELKASTPIRSASIPGTSVEGTMRRNWSFVIRHDSAGTWRWLSGLNVPLAPCAT